jgi:UDP-N-acetylmuramoylalanine--D-glutamate ligase
MTKQPYIAILGAGESGVGTAILAKKHGYKVLVSDRGVIKEKYRKVLQIYKIEFEEGKHSVEDILNADLIMKSPGIPDSVSLIKQAREKGIEVLSEIEFAFRYTEAKIIGITGSNGKTTTTMLTWYILNSAGVNVGLAGNIGQSFAWQVAEKDHDVYVLELSSFQLDGIKDFKADIAILTNITPDHLDRYEYKMSNYIDSKFRITMNQTSDDYFIYCDDDEVLQDEVVKRKINAKVLPYAEAKKQDEGAFLDIDNKEIKIIIDANIFTMKMEELALQGRHNTYNSMAAGVASRILEIRKDSIKQCLSDFQNVEHRLEKVGSVHGITFVNDSKATNVNSVWYALESVQTDVVWIAGGVDKGNEYQKLLPLVNEKVKTLICLGKDNSKLINAFGRHIDEIYETESMEDAVQMAYRVGKQGETVLLSPACASFDLFENYEERGDAFKKAVKKL